MSKKVLVIDDDLETGKIIETILKGTDLKVFQAYSGQDGLKKAFEIRPDLIILDIMMPGLDGYEVCARVREMANIPILMLTARATPSDLVRGFNVGADDYLKKPFNRDELVARVTALLRRSRFANGGEAAALTHYVDDILDIDLVTQIVEVCQRRIELTPTEYNLLACLVRNMGSIVPHHQILSEVWGGTYGDQTPTLTLYIFYLRKKIEDTKHGHQYIHTQWGRGYWFQPWRKE